MGIKSKLRLDDKFDPNNEDRYDTAYFHAYVEQEDGSLLPVAFTDHEIKKAAQRASKFVLPEAEDLKFLGIFPVS